MLQVNLPRTTCRDVTTATSQGSSLPIFSPHSVTECQSDTVTRPSMEEEVDRLLSGTLSNMPEQSCASVSPRRPPPVVPNTPAASKEKAPPDLGEIISVYLKQPPPSQQESSQADMVHITAHSSHSPSPTLCTLERTSAHPPPRVASAFYHAARWCPTPSRGDEQCHGSPTHLQGLSRYLLAKADIWVGDHPSPEWKPKLLKPSTG